MKGFKQCEKGHYYREDLDSCNFCPKPGGEISAVGGGDKTQILGSGSSAAADTDKTVVFGSGAVQGIQTEPHGHAPAQQDFTRTFIQEVTDKSGTGVVQTSVKKLAGWIVSYTLDPMGVDYKIYVGSNTIGRDMSNSIPILKDNAISAKHISILCKNGQFYIKDEMASNGTFLNDEELEIGKPYELKDGDKIRLGAVTSFIFKSAL